MYSRGGLHNQNYDKRKRGQQQHTKNYNQKREVGVCFLNACAIEIEVESQLICECVV